MPEESDRAIVVKKQANETEMTELKTMAMAVRSLWSEGPWRSEMPVGPPVTGTQSPGKAEDGLDRLRTAAKKEGGNDSNRPPLSQSTPVRLTRRRSRMR